LKNRYFLIISASILFLIIAIALIILMTGRKEKTSGIQSSATDSSFKQELLKAEEKVKVIVFLPSPEDEFLHPEERKILKTPSLSNQVKQLILEILKGSEKGNLSPIPSQTKIREVYIHKDGTAYVDLTSDFISGNSGGSSSEIEAIYTIVNSITFNFPFIKRVHFLIDGIERETLKGHLRLDRSFLPNYSMIKSE